MNFLRLLPVILSCLLLAAHFSRNEIMLLTLVSLALPFLLLVRRPWVPRLFQVLLVLGALALVLTGTASEEPCKLPETQQSTCSKTNSYFCDDFTSDFCS
jgi:hypothetical protein